nr:carboxymethylenebutenolidase homolog [Tanacetum cinerariifolium]
MEKSDVLFRPKLPMEKSDVLFRPKLPICDKQKAIMLVDMTHIGRKAFRKDIGGLKQMFKMIDADNNGTIKVIRLLASIKWMLDEFIAAGSSKKFGIVGFGFGGGKVVDVLPEDYNDYFAFGVSFYGTRIQPSVDAKT